MKQIVREPAATRSANRSAASLSAEAREPSVSSSSGGFHIAIVRSALGAPSSSIRRISSSPVSRCASSAGLATVALASRKRGSVPYAAASRRSRRSTFATCEPKTPR